jgi:hypothetical protein
MKHLSTMLTAVSRGSQRLVDRLESKAKNYWEVVFNGQIKQQLSNALRLMIHSGQLESARTKRL